MCNCITFRTNVYVWLMKAGMTMHEMLVYCAICDFIRNKQVARLTHRQIAELLGSEDKSESPNISRRTIKGLVKKGFIEVIYQGHEGSANHYALLKTPYDIFLQIDKEDPDYFSDAQRTAHIHELKLNNVGYGKPAEAEQQSTPEAETTMTVDAHNWENREKDIKKQARQLWDSKYKTKAEQHKSVALHWLRDELRGQEATACKDVRPDKYWNIHKQDFEIILWMIKQGLDVVVGQAPWRNVESALTEDGHVTLKLVEDIEEVAYA